MGTATYATAGAMMGDERDYLQACRRVLAAGVLARDRAEVLAIDPGRWPRAAAHLRERIASPGATSSPEAELEMLDFGHELQVGLAETVERLIDKDVRLAEVLLRLQLDCARVRFVFEETAMRLQDDPARFAHAESHGRLLQRLTDAKIGLRAARWEEARATIAAFRAEVEEHARTMDSRAGRRIGGGS
jgi:hemerythrin